MTLCEPIRSLACLIIRISARIKIRRDSNYQVISVMTATVGTLVEFSSGGCGWCGRCCLGTRGLCETWSPSPAIIIMSAGAVTLAWSRRITRREKLFDIS